MLAPAEGTVAELAFVLLLGRASFAGGGGRGIRRHLANKNERARLQGMQAGVRARS